MDIYFSNHDFIFDLVVPKIKRLSVPTMEQASNSISDAPTDLGDQNVVPMRSKAPSSSPSTWIQNSREKDKSTKRKSNLNRALTDEQILSAGQPDCQGTIRFSKLDTSCLRSIFSCLHVSEE